MAKRYLMIGKCVACYIFLPKGLDNSFAKHHLLDKQSKRRENLKEEETSQAPLKCYLLRMTKVHFLQVLVLAHVPPGKFEKHRDYTWFYSDYNERFTFQLAKFKDVIGSVHMAHHHTDSYRLIRQSSEQFIHDTHLVQTFFIQKKRSGCSMKRDITLFKYINTHST